MLCVINIYLIQCMHLYISLIPLLITLLHIFFYIPLSSFIFTLLRSIRYSNLAYFLITQYACISLFKQNKNK
uniref:Uncharacterized protein n=1 Tax=Octopus bimaculoides TaxID=37653 RepID=A0A0L8GUZ5_OCTBM